ncbi:hypothetical protein PGB28_20075 [Primorskyibacter aestuariivivens]|uniref:hypothetical protein n=1 Tax=Primorskyibacter aestuariivivens TaxID=1888912 RepID=UPI0022FFFE95|nr:hypothetical protein [Primorskyibacter aestuariivivens]MDA7430765.1 hypothetical protein [Primorskyibacter aestuariivivens]
MIRLLLICLSLWLGGAAVAASFEPGPPDQCQLRMSGPIVPGDAEALRARLDAYYFDDGETSDQFLCVASPGGSFSEAIKLGKILIKEGIGTRIEAGQSCLSACAVAFMMGSKFFYEGVGDGQNANRHMHVTSRLGFHRPELKLAQEGVFDTAAVEQSFDVAIQATLEFVRVANEGSGISTMVPPDLIEAMFEHKGEDFYFVETTGQTARWDIKVDGLNLPHVMTPLAAWYACANIPVWKTRYEPEVPPPEGDWQVQRVGQEQGAPVYEVLGPFQSDAEHFCRFRYTGANGPNALYGCGLLGRENQIVGTSICMGQGDEGRMDYITSDLRVFLPPATPLTQADAVARRIAGMPAGQEGGAPDRLDRFRAGCATNGGQAFVTNVRNFTNLRRNATIGSDTLEQVPLDARVAIIAPRVVPDLGGISARCRDLCQRAPGGGLAGREAGALNACFDANAFWYRVQTGTGRLGYLSGKFLRR